MSLFLYQQQSKSNTCKGKIVRVHIYLITEKAKSRCEYHRDDIHPDRLNLIQHNNLQKSVCKLIINHIDEQT